MMTSDYKEATKRGFIVKFGLTDDEAERCYRILDRTVDTWPSPLGEIALPIFEKNDSHCREILDPLIVLFVKTRRSRRRTISTE